jgi:hypothetical protein
MVAVLGILFCVLDKTHLSNSKVFAGIYLHANIQDLE